MKEDTTHTKTSLIKPVTAKQGSNLFPKEKEQSIELPFSDVHLQRL